MSSAWRRNTYRWLNLLLFFAGVALLALAYWLDVRDGVPTLRKGDQPFEVVLTGGLGFAALGSGLYRFWKSFKSDDEQRKR
ncbi:hypothetical protein [Microbacterium galbinum]|uniref:Uncharacterized protein n=1 Tax=Microbacterium galbinum TaxID=2851646 RepID=A0ABY4IPP2_9MICO|nr:hypothetical protein [Microbacterium galbinum]UPL14762.1 hypothetical protein KV396_09845 [Microbacterium galbinum]